MKENLKSLLSNYSKAQGSANKAAKSLGISAALISYIQSDQWDKVSEDMIIKLLSKLEIWEATTRMPADILEPFRKVLTYEQPQATKKYLLDLLLESKEPETQALLRVVYEAYDESILNVIRNL